MKVVQRFQTSDGVLHDDIDKAKRHAEKRYGDALVGIANELLELEVRFKKDDLEMYREEIRQIAGKIVPDSLMGTKGDENSGNYWVDLQYDRNGDEWGKPLHANLLVSMCNALGFMEFCHPWNPSDPAMKLLMKITPFPAIRFFSIIREPAKVLH
jgi:hypothetical protein